MKKHDNFNIFREHQHLWEETPSDALWSRLEQRLDAHQKPAKVVRFRPFVVAASFLLLLAGASFLMLQIQQKRVQFATLTEGYQTVELEPLHTTDTPIYQPPQYANAGIINEGAPTNRLVAAANSFYKDGLEEQSKASVQFLVDTLQNAAEELLALPRNFDWLLGNWKGKTKIGESIESWTKASKNN